MKKLILLSIIATIILPSWAQESFGGLMFSARLDTTQESSPGVPSSANGVAGFSFHNDTLWFDITANGLTGPITGAHIHSESGGTVKYSLVSFIDRNKIKGYLTGISLKDGDLKPFFDGGYYVNIHTASNPAGEIAGRILPEADKNYLAKLDMAQAGNINPPDTTPAGVGSFNLSQDNTKLEVNVLANELTGSITNAHLHYGAPGVSGPPIVPLSQFRVGNSYKGVYDLTTLGSPSAFLDSLRQGKVYVNVHTSKHPGGEIRGQLWLNRTLSFDTWMSPAQETGTIDPATSANAMGLCNFAVNSMIDSLWVNMQADSLSGTITGAHFHSGKAGESGSVVASLTGFISGNVISGVLTPADFTGSLDFDSFVTKAISGDIYVNMHTALNQAGEVRGQPATLTRKGVVFSLCTAQETGTVSGAADAQGSGFVTLDRNHSNLHYGMAVSNLSSAVLADHFHEGLPGVSAPPIFTLPTDSVIMGFWNDAAFTSVIADKFESGAIYANFHTANNTGGEIRGQVALGDLCSPSTGIVDHTRPGQYAVSIYPNPVRTYTAIRYSLPQNGAVLLSLYSLLGKKVSTLSQGTRSAGIYIQNVDATALPNGVYFYRLQVNGIPVNSGKVIVNK